MLRISGMAKNRINSVARHMVAYLFTRWNTWFFPCAYTAAPVQNYELKHASISFRLSDVLLYCAAEYPKDGKGTIETERPGIFGCQQKCPKENQDIVSDKPELRIQSWALIYNFALTNQWWWIELPICYNVLVMQMHCAWV